MTTTIILILYAAFLLFVFPVIVITFNDVTSGKPKRTWLLTFLFRPDEWKPE